MFKGSMVALITPFKESGEIDVENLRELVQRQVKHETDAIVCCATTGEAPTLSPEEHTLVVKTVIEAVKKRIGVIVGTGTYDTRVTVRRTEEALRMGADGALVVMPYYNRPTFEGCLAHFTEVGRVGLPTIIYYHPGRTGVRLTAEQLGEISRLPSMVGIKDCSGNLDFIRALRFHTQLPIFSGDDTLAFAHLKEGAQGVISPVANLIPVEWKEMIHCFLKGDIKRAQELFETYLPLCEAVVIENNPQGLKYAAHLLGLCAPYLRLPLVQIRESSKEVIRQALQRNLLKKSSAPLSLSFCRNA